jgi:hypothetical protein
MRDDPHPAGLDALIDETARALTAAAPPASLRGTVRRRMGSLKVEPRVPVWQPVLGALLVGLIAVTLWPARTSDLAPVEGTSRMDIALPGEPSPLDDGARPVSGSAAAMRPQRLDPPAGVSGSRSGVAPAGRPTGGASAGIGDSAAHRRRPGCRRAANRGGGRGEDRRTRAAPCRMARD